MSDHSTRSIRHWLLVGLSLAVAIASGSIAAQQAPGNATPGAAPAAPAAQPAPRPRRPLDPKALRAGTYTMSGELRKPGIYVTSADGDIRLNQALASAGVNDGDFPRWVR